MYVYRRMGEKSMTIRKMRIMDYEGVYALWLSCSGMGLNTIDDSKDGVALFLARNPDTCFVAEENGALVGVVMAGSDGRRGYIYHTAVDSNFRRRGIGTALVKTALAALKELGIVKTALVVFGRNAAGNAFWERLGFNQRSDLVYRNITLIEADRIDT